MLQNSNRLAVRLRPCDVLVPVSPAAHRATAEFEVEMARQLAAAESPAARLEPRVEPGVYLRDGFNLTFWTYYEPVSTLDVPPDAYASALERLHAGMRAVSLPVPHFTDRVAEAQRLVTGHHLTPELSDADRELLVASLRKLSSEITRRASSEHLLHGEPHPGNLLNTTQGPLFIDLETCCRGPVEFDVAHAPEAVCGHYPGIDQELVGRCRALMMAMVAAWRWDRRDQFPDGRQMGLELLRRLRDEHARYDLEAIP